MSTVIIGANSYEVYGDVAGATAYWAAGLGPTKAAWSAASADDKVAGLVQATRFLDRQAWQGLPVGVPVVDVVLQWPRTGVTDANGTEVSSLTVPALIIQATYELAAAIIANPAIITQVGSGSNVQRIKADEVEVEFFSSTMFITGVFPANVQDLIGQFLSGASSTGTTSSTAFGTDATSAFDSTDVYTVGR